MSDTKLVKMLRTVESNNVGEICSFSVEKAAELVEAKLAVYTEEKEHKAILDTHHRHKRDVERRQNQSTSTHLVEAPRGYVPPGDADKPAEKTKAPPPEKVQKDAKPAV